MTAREFVMNNGQSGSDFFTEKERAKIAALRAEAQPILEMGELRIETAIDSLYASRRRFEEARLHAAAADRCYHEALLCLAEDDDDDFDTARAKSEKLERIEQEFIAANVVLERALKRAEWEIGEAI
jgi:hypothetical protein